LKKLLQRIDVGEDKDVVARVARDPKGALGCADKDTDFTFWITPSKLMCFLYP
jgi:hypothetical protein